MEKKFRKNKKFSPERKQEIVEYAKRYGLKDVKERFGVWPECVRYWMYPELRQSMSEKGKKRYKETLKNDEERNEKCKLYREYRAESGITREKWLEWWNNLTPEEQEEKREYNRQYRTVNYEERKKKSKEKYLREKAQGLHRKKYNEDPLHKMKCNIREHVRQAVKYANISKTHPSITYLGCSLEDFRAYIEEKFQEGMTWDNHGRGENCWHLDHIKPLAALKDVADVEALREVCHYTNYQPLWEKDNLSKQDKYEG